MKRFVLYLLLFLAGGLPFAWLVWALELSGGGGVGTTSGGGSLTVQEIDGTPSGTFTTLKFSNGSMTNNGDGSATIVTGVGGGGDFSSNTSLSVDSEIVLFSGVGGKIGKRATGTGFARVTSGVFTPAELSGDCATSGSAVVTCTKLNGGAFIGATGNIVTFGTSNTPSDSGVAMSSVPLLSTTNTFTGANTFSNAAGLSVKKLVMPGATSGVFTMSPPDVAGASSLKWPAMTLDFNVTGGSGQVVKQTINGGPLSVGPIVASDIGSGQALTKTDDTNVTLSLGGTPGSALLAPASITAGWTGQLSVARGGTGASFAGTGGPGQVVKQTTTGGPFSTGTVAASDITGGQAFSKVDDTNVTLALGGTPATALLAPTTLTVGWAGQLGLSRGGTAANLAATGGASQVLRQNTAGGAVTVSRLSCADLTDAGTGCSGTGTGGGGAVNTVFGRSGNVVAVSGDYTVSQVTNAVDITAANTFPNAAGQTMPKLNLSGSTSGTLSMSAANVSGSSSIKWPSGTVDFTATGGANAVVKQITAGGMFGVGPVNYSEIVGTPPGITAVGTCSSGSCFTDSTPGAGMTWQAVTTPSTPAAGSGHLYLNSVTNTLALVSDTGIVSHMARSLTPTTSVFVTGLNDNGVLQTGTPTKTDVGLGNVDNTSDATKNSATAVLTNKQVVDRVATLTPVSNTITPNADTTDIAENFTLAASTTIAAPSATAPNPRDQQRLEFVLKSAAPQVLTWNAAYSTTCGIALPATTTGDGTTYDHFLFLYHADNSTWCLVASTKAPGQRITTLASATTYTCPNGTSDRCEMQMTGTSGTLTVAAPTGTAQNGDMLLLAFLCTNAQTLSWNSIFVGSPNVPLPTTCPSNVNQWTVAGVQYSTVLSKWQLLATN